MAAEPPSFRRILLAFNPAAGPRRRDRTLLNAVAKFLSGASVETCQVMLGAEGLGAIEHDIQTFDAVFICGGDGTINHALQHLMARQCDVPLGVIPIGSGNLFAGSMGTPRNVVSAAKALLKGERRRVSVGTISRNGDAGTPRYWIAAAGVGADARVICGIKPRLKARFGAAAYYAESVRQLCSPRLDLPLFRVEFTDRTGLRRSELVTQVIAERMAYFGNAVSRPAENLADDELRLVLIKSPSRWVYLRFGASLVASQLQLGSSAGSDVEVAIAKQVNCVPVSSCNGHAKDNVLAEVDGELIGEAPVHLSVRPQAATVIVPSTRTN